MRYRLPRALKALLDRVDARVMARADSVIFPDRSRIPSWAPAHSVVVENSAPEVEITRFPDPGRLTVYACGNLRADRGVGLLLDAAAEIDGCFVLAAGKCRDPRLAERLASAPNVDYRGELTPVAALQLCGEADVVLTFYEPGLEINRYAISNKWSDAMMAARPILINAEVEKAAWVKEQGIGYACAYDKDALIEMLRRITEDRVDAAARGARGRKLWERGYRWDVAEQQLVTLIEQAASARPAPTAPAPA
jgi:glycosyltransferase involved in cell wall biosynthesis